MVKIQKNLKGKIKELQNIWQRFKHAATEKRITKIPSVLVQCLKWVKGLLLRIILDNYNTNKRAYKTIVLIYVWRVLLPLLLTWNENTSYQNNTFAVKYFLWNFSTSTSFNVKGFLFILIYFSVLLFHLGPSADIKRLKRKERKGEDGEGRRNRGEVLLSFRWTHTAFRPLFHQLCPVMLR